MKVFKIIAGVLIAATSVVAVSTISAKSAGATASTDKCVFVYENSQGAYGLGQGFVKSSSHVSTSFKIAKAKTGDKHTFNCDQGVTLTTWKIPNMNKQHDGNEYPLEEQVYFSHQTINKVTAGSYTLKTNMPDCFWQADVVIGRDPTGPNGKLPYEANRLRNAHLGGTKKCVEPEEPKDVCPNIDGNQSEVPEGHELDENGNCVVPEEPETPEEPKGRGEDKPKVKAVQTPPSGKLPATGAGAVAGTFIGVTTLAGALHAAVRRFFK